MNEAKKATKKTKNTEKRTKETSKKMKIQNEPLEVEEGKEFEKKLENKICEKQVVKNPKETTDIENSENATFTVFESTNTESEKLGKINELKGLPFKWLKSIRQIKENDPRNFTAGVALVGSVIVVLIIITMMAVNSGSLSILTKAEEKMPSVNKESKYVGDLFGKEKTIVYYPDLPGEDGKAVKRNASKILFENKEHGGTLSIDYSMTNFNDKYIGIKYPDLKEDNTYFFSLEGEKITAEVLDDFLKFHIKMATKANMKKKESLSEYASSTEFKEKLEAGEIPYEFTITDNEINIIYNDIYKEENLQFALPLDTFSDHIDLDLGVEQANPNMKAISPIRYVDPDKPMIALTFDDGPLEENTREIVEELYKYDGAATFYVLGGMTSRTSQHQIIIDMVNMGNEIGSHSITHPNLSALANSDEKKDAKRLHNELYGTQEDVKNITGGYVVETFRPPYGLANKKVRAKGNFPFIYWDVDSQDWSLRNSEKIYNGVMKDVEDGDVVLLHDIHKETVPASIKLIQNLSEQGYQLVTVSELMEAKGLEMEPHQIYFW